MPVIAIDLKLELIVLICMGNLSPHGLPIKTAYAVYLLVLALHRRIETLLATARHVYFGL